MLRALLNRGTGGRAVLGLGDLGDDRVVGHLALGDRGPCLGGDAVLGVERAQRILRQVRVYLDLVDGRHGVGLVEQPLQVGLLEVGDVEWL